ncbi:MAG TPA: MFS transporter, partial [Bryobacteraceae bacterium]|nr:MFS transporter [Bryobacteraceae bacterium]
MNESSIRYPGWRVAIAASGCVLVSFASLLVFTFSVFLKPVTEEFHWSREAASVAFAIAAMTVAVCSPPIGMLLDRYPTRRVLLPCLTVFGLAFASLSLLTPHLWHLYAVFFVLGVVGNGTAQLASSRAVTTWFQERRGLALAVLMTGGSFGVTVWPPLTQSLIDHFGWRTATAVLGFTVLAIGWPLGLLVKERGGFVRSHGAPPASGATVAEGLRSRIFWVIVAVLFCGSFSQNGAITHISAMLTDRGVSASGAALAASSMGVTAMAGRMLTGWLIDRFFAPRVALILMLVA